MSTMVTEESGVVWSPRGLTPPLLYSYSCDSCSTAAPPSALQMNTLVLVLLLRGPL